MISRHWLYFGGFVITGTLLVGVGLMGLVDALSVLSGGPSYSGELVLLAMLGEAAEWVLIGFVLGLIAVVFLAATVISIIRTASLPRDDRLVALVEWLERKYPVLRRFEVSKTVEPTTEDRKRQIKEQYIDGEISDEEFERKMEQLMTDTPSKKNVRSGDSRTVDMEDR